MDNISKHVSWKEATHSNTAVSNNIQNIPSTQELETMKLTATKCFEPLREWYGKPIKINSFYRCPELNKKVGGSATSSHVKGEAMDIDADSVTENKKIYNWCKENLEFDQLIWEYGGKWIHISYRKNGNRKQVFSID